MKMLARLLFCAAVGFAIAGVVRFCLFAIEKFPGAGLFAIAVWLAVLGVLIEPKRSD